MKHVVKGAAPRSFEDWKVNGDDNWNPTYADLQNPEKRDVHEALVREQLFVCCYCGRSITFLDSHIEHFRPQGGPQSVWRHLDLSYENMHASCVRETQPGLPLHCGHAKAGEFCESLHISPLDPDCEKRFVYALDGGIAGIHASDLSAVYMVTLLRLDVPLLRSYRQEVLTRVFDIAFLGSATTEELQILRDRFCQSDAGGHAVSWGHVVARYADQLLEVTP
jgi:uncharacterized protein (TIGR02646 family)